MTAATLLDQTRRDGLEVSANDGRLKVRGPAVAVKKWTPVLVANKPELLAVLTAPIAPDLEHLIVRAGAFWEYSHEDFDLIRRAARVDPEGLRRALLGDWGIPYMEAIPPAPPGSRERNSDAT